MAKADFIRAHDIIVRIHKLKNNDEECYNDGGQNLIGYVNVLMHATKIYHLDHRLSLWDIK